MMAPPPFSEAKAGKRQMLPRPTAEPIAAKMKAVRPEKAPRSARLVAPGGWGLGRCAQGSPPRKCAEGGRRGQPPRGEGRGAVTVMPLTGTAPEPTAGEVFGPDGSPRGEGCSRRYEPYAARPTGSPRRA